MPDQTPGETRRVSLDVITQDGEMTNADARVPLDLARDLVDRACGIAPGDRQIVLVVARPGEDPRVVVRSRADAAEAAGLLADLVGDV
jgi:hypothetical protein